MTTRSKIRRQKPWTKATIILSIFILVACLGVSAKDHLFASIEELIYPKSIHEITYRISSGDTLWLLAGKTVQEGEDVRDKVIAIRKMNGLTATQSLIPGQTIRIPMKSSADSVLRYTRYTLNE